MAKGRILITFITVILIGMLIFFNDALGIKDYVFKLTKPLLRITTRVREFVFDEGTEKILEENRHLKSLIFELENLRVENSTLKKVLSFAEETKTELRGAGVIFYSQESGKEFLIIDQGKEAGIKIGDLAADRELIFIGVVKEVGSGFAKVGVAANPGETFEAEIISSRVKALARGLGAGSMAIELLPLDISLSKGDLVGLLSKEKFLPLAEIVTEKVISGSAFKEARAVSLARPESARQVFIISNEAPH